MRGGWVCGEGVRERGVKGWVWGERVRSGWCKGVRE